MESYLPVLYAILALGGLGIVFGLLLGVADKKFSVEMDERVSAVRSAVAGANCGACGYAGCDGYAEAVVRGEAKTNACTPGGEKTANAIAAIMCVSADVMEPMVARVRCQGNCENVTLRYDYDGIPSCRAASGISGGPTACEFGCVGLGDCVSRCPFHAISMQNGVAVIDGDICTGCGICVAACPRGIIQMMPLDQTIVVMCRNEAIGRIARLQCKTACVGCKRCEKQCPSDSIHVVKGVALIDEKTCTRCGACILACPMHCIVNFYEHDLTGEAAATAQAELLDMEAE
ncbi:MAG: RnfABCDGE type electron transport complex subunit B [Eubacteriales bacterium]|nr:RnfABCDGE type electron transport complex subunit B [Eubacteriales bacterium]